MHGGAELLAMEEMHHGAHDRERKERVSGVAGKAGTGGDGRNRPTPLRLVGERERMGRRRTFFFEGTGELYCILMFIRIQNRSGGSVNQTCLPHAGRLHI